MTNEDVRRLLNAKPFEPFAIRLVDGRSLEIHHPDFVWFPERNQRVMYVTDNHGHETIVNTTIVLLLERLPSRAAARSA